MTGSAAIVVEGVSKRFKVYKSRPTSLKERVTRFARDRYEEFWALDDVSLEVPEASVYGLVGHNGSGKSSLLRLMANIHRPTKGRIVANGRISALLELGAGFHPDLTGRENIYLNAAILGFRRRDTDKILDEIVEFSGIEPFIDTPVKHYSSGMYVRLGFSVAVHVDPQILLIDEVIAVGDEEFQRRCFEHLYRLRNRGVTIVMVTHSLGLVQSMCSRAAWLDHGKLLAEGPAGDVVHHYVSKVNEREAERFEHEAEAASELGVPEGGLDVEASLRPLSIEGVEFLGPDGQPTQVALSLEPLTVRMHYRASEPVESPLFSFAVESANGVHVATPGMRPDDRRSEVLVGEGYVDYRIDRLALAPGEYLLSTAVHDRHGMIRFDHQQRCATLHVQRSSRSVPGLVDLLGRWEAPVGPRAEALR